MRLSGCGTEARAGPERRSLGAVGPHGRDGELVPVGASALGCVGRHNHCQSEGTGADSAAHGPTVAARRRRAKAKQFSLLERGGWHAPIAAMVGAPHPPAAPVDTSIVFSAKHIFQGERSLGLTRAAAGLAALVVRPAFKLQSTLGRWGWTAEAGKSGRWHGAYVGPRRACPRTDDGTPPRVGPTLATHWHCVCRPQFWRKSLS